MLSIKINKVTIWDSDNNKYIEVPETVISLEHSLYSISKWESYYKKPFYDRDNKTNISNGSETLYYIKCMTVSIKQNGIVIDEPNDVIYYLLLNDESNIKKISSYISDTMSAYVVNNQKQIGVKELHYAETYYSWMIASNIPMECQYWHFNRLMMLIQACSKLNAPEEKLSKQDIIKRNRELNALRKKQFNTRG